MQREVYFSWSTNQKPVPFVREVVEYVNDGSAGHITFDGHWYIREDHPLPRPIEFTAKLVATEPFEAGVDASGNRYEKYALRDIRTYTAIATERTEIQDTSDFWPDEEEGGEICLFPTALQRINFTVTTLKDERAEDVRHVTYGTLWVPSGPTPIGTDSTAISANDVDDVLDEC